MNQIEQNPNGHWVTHKQKSVMSIGDYIIREYNNFSISLITKTKFEFYPSQIISKVVGCKLHTNWDVIQSKMWVENHNLPNDELDRRFFDLLSKYPEFENIKSKDKFIKIDIYNGCISKLNFEDIKHYCEVKWTDRDTGSRQSKLETRLKLGFQWILSHSTLDTLEKYIERTGIVITKDIIKHNLIK